MSVIAREPPATAAILSAVIDCRSRRRLPRNDSRKVHFRPLQAKLGSAPQNDAPYLYLFHAVQNLRDVNRLERLFLPIQQTLQMH